MEYSRQETQPAEAMIMDEKKRASSPEVVEDVSDTTQWRAECQVGRYKAVTLPERWPVEQEHEVPSSVTQEI